MKLNDTTINAITLRDVFAAVALHGLLNTIAKNVGIARHIKVDDFADVVAEEAYAQADAMLARRNIKED